MEAILKFIQIKKSIFLTLLLIFPACVVFSQTGKITQTVVKDNGIDKVSYNGRLYDIDTTTVTVKVQNVQLLKQQVNVKRENILGYIDVKILIKQ